MGALFDGVRENVTALEAAKRYGLSVNRYGKALCPWHDDKHASLSFDTRTGRCKCFSCHAGGTCIDLTAKLLNVSILEAATQLNADFALGLDDTTRPARDSPRVMRKQQDVEHRQALIRVTQATVDKLQAIMDGFTPESAESEAELFTATLKALANTQIKLAELL